MELVNLHHLGVPCVAEIKDYSGPAYGNNNVFHLNNEALIRMEPGGAVITSPHLYASFLFADNELTSKLRLRQFTLENLPAEQVKTLLDNNIIIQGPAAGDKIYREVQVSGLPTQVLFEVTSACNCDCLGCYHFSDLKGALPDLAQLRLRIDKLNSLGLCLYEVTGGEPFLRPDLEDILSYILDSGSLFYVVTNGSLLRRMSPELISILRRGLGLAISLDGIGKTHDRVRRHAGLYAKIIEGLDVLASEKVKFYLISTLNSENIDETDQMAELAAKYGTTIHLRPTIQTGAAIRNNVASLDLRPHLQHLFGSPAVRNGLLSTKKSIPISRYYGCGLRKRISVDSEGNMFPCVMDRARHLGNIMSFEPDGLVNKLHEETKFFLQMNQQCKECKLNNSEIRCGGFCRFSSSFKDYQR